MTLPEVLGVIVATAVTVVLRWAAHRWPMPPPKHGKKRKHDDDDEETSDE